MSVRRIQAGPARVRATLLTVARHGSAAGVQGRGMPGRLEACRAMYRYPPRRGWPDATAARGPGADSASTPTGARRTTCPSARSTCSTTRCCASRCGSSTSSRACSATGARRPGLNFVYVHLNRAIVERDLNAIYVCGPGHGGPGMVANAYLEGTYSERYSGITPGRRGAAAPVQAVLVSRRHSQPRRARDARLDQRGRRARLHRWPTPTAPPSTIPTCWSPAWSATARPRPARWRRPGTRTSS